MMVAASLGHELRVSPLLHHLSVLNEDDPICRLHRLQVMSHQENRAAPRQNLPQHLSKGRSAEPR